MLAEEQELCPNDKIHLKAAPLSGQLKSFSLIASLRMPCGFMDSVCVRVCIQAHAHTYTQIYICNY